MTTVARSGEATVSPSTDSIANGGQVWSGQTPESSDLEGTGEGEGEGGGDKTGGAVQGDAAGEGEVWAEGDVAGEGEAEVGGVAIGGSDADGAGAGAQPTTPSTRASAITNQPGTIPLPPREACQRLCRTGASYD